uniref:Uncharacterized protein n=1 Tax=Physcomitrium patens TaxID=3218 RepID=A0A2K1IV31_PHYPA|nr:hypothetical protein PHYPA_025075 [Physcomitrium patens]
MSSPLINHNALWSVTACCNLAWGMNFAPLLNCTSPEGYCDDDSNTSVCRGFLALTKFLRLSHRCCAVEALLQLDVSILSENLPQFQD